MKIFVAYYRVSTQKQEHGIDAQRALAEAYTRKGAGVIVAEHEEKASGKLATRQGLKDAIEDCKAQGATLLIAKLDRLSRDASFLFNLKHDLDAAGVDVVAADMPEVLSNTLMLAVMAGMAQHERELISKRTKEGLAAARAKGVKIGRDKGCDTSKARAASIKSKRKTAAAFHKSVSKIAQWSRKEGWTFQRIAMWINENTAYTTTKGKAFTATSIRRILINAEK